MENAWFLVQCATGAVAAILVWLFIVAVVVTHVEERRRGPHHAARHSHGR